jgi:hypothetical protein
MSNPDFTFNKLKSHQVQILVKKLDVLSGELTWDIVYGAASQLWIFCDTIQIFL